MISFQRLEVPLANAFYTRMKQMPSGRVRLWLAFCYRAEKLNPALYPKYSESHL